MKRTGLFDLASRHAPRVLGVRRRTWIGVAIGFLVLLSLMTWAALALLAWLWGQASEWRANAPAIVRQTVEKADQVVPGLKQKVGELVPWLASDKPSRDVSGSDLGPVPRYPGLVRNQWARDGRRVTVAFEGRAEYPAVLDHYVRGFRENGFAQTVESATPVMEKHLYVKATERYAFEIRRAERDTVQVRLASNVD